MSGGTLIALAADEIVDLVRVLLGDGPRVRRPTPRPATPDRSDRGGRRDPHGRPLDARLPDRREPRPLPPTTSHDRSPPRAPPAHGALSAAAWPAAERSSTSRPPTNRRRAARSGRRPPSRHRRAADGRTRRREWMPDDRRSDRRRLPGMRTRNRLPAAASGTPRCGRCKEAMAWIADADHATFPEIAEASPIPVIVDPWAPGCGPCRTVGPIVEELAGEFAGQYKLVQGQRRLRAPPRQPLRRPRHPDPGRPASRPGGIAPGGRGARRSASPMDGGGTPGVIGKGGNRCLSSPTSVPCSGPSGRPTSRSKQRHPWTRPSPTGTSSGCRCRVRSTSSVTAGVLGDIPRVRLQEHTGPAERAAALATPHGFDRARSLGHRRPGSRVPERGPMRRRRRWWPSTYPLRR